MVGMLAVVSECTLEHLHKKIMQQINKKYSGDKNNEKKITTKSRNK